MRRTFPIASVLSRSLQPWPSKKPKNGCVILVVRPRAVLHRVQLLGGITRAASLTERLPSMKELPMTTRNYVEYSEQTDNKRYPSDLTDAEWALIEAFVQQKPGPGRPHEIDRREIVNALFYLTCTGCQWRYLPKDLPDYHSVNYYFRIWTEDHTLEQINTALRRQIRIADGRDAEPSAAIIDSQSVKSTESGVVSSSLRHLAAIVFRVVSDDNKMEQRETCQLIRELPNLIRFGAELAEEP